MLSGLGDTAGRTIGNTGISGFDEIDGTAAINFYMYITYSVIYALFVVVAAVCYRKFVKSTNLIIGFDLNHAEEYDKAIDINEYDPCDSDIDKEPTERKRLNEEEESKVKSETELKKK